ncbi:MAG: hypothetical protein ABSF34_17660 [Verrucomicrobiota bacterium]
MATRFIIFGQVLNKPVWRGELGEVYSTDEFDYIRKMARNEDDPRNWPAPFPPPHHSLHCDHDDDYWEWPLALRVTRAWAALGKKTCQIRRTDVKRPESE